MICQMLLRKSGLAYAETIFCQAAFPSMVVITFIVTPYNTILLYNDLCVTELILFVNVLIKTGDAGMDKMTTSFQVNTSPKKNLNAPLYPSGTFNGRISWESTFGGSKSFKASLSISTVTRQGWSLKSMAMSTTCRKRKMNGGRRCCPRQLWHDLLTVILGGIQIDTHTQFAVFGN